MTIKLSRRSAACVLLVIAPLLAVRAEDTRPNFIVVQPDDLHFFENWNPPAHFNTARPNYYPPNSQLPWMNFLRSNGLEMTRAYTASPKCGTSRYSTLTGRYPSRSSYGREINIGQTVSNAVIKYVKLQDEPIVDGQDCSRGNLAALLGSDGYRTGMIGKWHLTNVNRRTYNYAEFQQTVRNCGFDYVEAAYKDNIDEWATSDGFHHNMEYVTAKGIEFIVHAAPADERVPFFMYFNPTVPHGPSVEEALRNYSCTDTPKGANQVHISEVNNIPRMTADYNGDCAAYRQSIFNRAAPSTNSKDLGSIWVDDSIGALITTLQMIGELDNTFFLFQQDHGQEGKSSLFEPGVRISQFIHFPQGNFATSRFDGVVSTIDVGPTILDYAGISSSVPAYYSMDGRSWKNAAQSGSNWGEEEVCIFGEMDQDRSVICGCDKYMRIYDIDSTISGTVADGKDTRYGIEFAQEMLFDLCGGDSTYETSPAPNPEQRNEIYSRQSRAQELAGLMSCHIANTNPNQSPNYSTCTVSPAPPTPPTPAPPPPPTPSCVDNSSNIITKRGTQKDCSWVARTGRCDRWGWTCPNSCNECQ